MKHIIKITVLAFVIALSSSLRNTVSAQNYSNRNDVSYQTFYDQLSPYGSWIDYPEYGYVWVPNAGPDFRPYSSNGHWVWTDNYEWMWASDYDWGWAPFHYGRWLEDNYYGWVWVPGYEWSPAWVAWRDGGDYYGWAPLRPGITIGINFNIGSYNPPYDYWCFAPHRYITSPRIYDYCVDRRQNLTIINYTTIINNNNLGEGYGFRSGPRRYDAERYCGNINPVRFRDSYTPGRTSYRNNEISIYRPNISRDDNHQYAPRQFERYDRREVVSGNGRNDNGFRGDNNGRRNTDVNNQSNGRSDSRNRVDNSSFRRNDGNVKQPQTNGNNNNFPDRRRFGNDNTNGQIVDNSNTRVFKPSEQRDRNKPVQGNGDNSNNRFERRQPNVRNDNNNWQQRQPVQQIERRQDPGPQQRQVQQIERRQEPATQQQQTRQFERRSDDNGNRQQQSSNDSRGNGGGNHRRF